MVAKIQSPDFGQAQADARKADADLKLAERNLARRASCSHTARRRKKTWRRPRTITPTPNQKKRARFKDRSLTGRARSTDESFFRSARWRHGRGKTVNPGQEVRSDQMLANYPVHRAVICRQRSVAFVDSN